MRSCRLRWKNSLTLAFETIFSRFGCINIFMQFTVQRLNARMVHHVDFVAIFIVNRYLFQAIKLQLKMIQFHRANRWIDAV